MHINTQEQERIEKPEKRLPYSIRISQFKILKFVFGYSRFDIMLYMRWPVLELFHGARKYNYSFEMCI